MSSEYRQQQLYVSPLQNMSFKIACLQFSYMKYTLKSEEAVAVGAFSLQ